MHNGPSTLSQIWMQPGYNKIFWYLYFPKLNKSIVIAIDSACLAG